MPFTAIPTECLRTVERTVCDVIKRPALASGQRAVELRALLDCWERVRSSTDEIDHRDFFARLYTLVVGCNPPEEERG